MLLLEHFPMLAGWNLRIEGTDLSGEVVEPAPEPAAITASRSTAAFRPASSCATSITSAKTGS